MSSSSPVAALSRVRLRPWHLALCVLLTGWVPSLLVAYLSYGTLSRALDEKINADAQSLASALAKLVEDNLVRTGETVDYYRTLPGTAAVLHGALFPATAASPPTRGRAPVAAAGAAPTLAPSPAPSAAQEWLSGIYYAQTRVDGMFLTDPSGKLLAAMPPPSPALLGRDYASEHWKHPTDAANAVAMGVGFTISPAYPRPGDSRLVSSAVVAVRDKGDVLLGYLGADTLIERIGRRLAVTQLTRRGQTVTQIIDGRGFPLFTRTLGANRPEERAGPPELLEAIRSQRAGGQAEIAGTDYFFYPIERAGWTALLEQPTAVVHQPVRDMRSQTVLMVGWLVAGCALAAYLISKLYRRQLNAALIVEREKVFSESILANLPVGIALIDAHGERLIQANDAFLAIARTLGTLPPACAQGSGRKPDPRLPFADLRIADPAALRETLRTGQPFRAVEQRRDAFTVGGDLGHTVFLTINLLRLQDSAGGVLGVLCLVEDSTAELALRQELIDANSTKDQFFAQLSHELRTPLSPVVTMVAELEALTASMDGNAPAARRALEVIRRNVRLEARLIDDLLDITRIRSGKLPLARENTDVHRAIHLALEITAADLREKNLRVDLHLDAVHHHAFADPARLQQVFWNLIKNSIKFTPAGRRLTIRTVNEETPDAERRMLDAGGATVSAALPHVPSSTPHPPLPAPLLRVEVTDEGIGIAPEHLTGIFHAFDQGGSGTTRRFGGLGLGLAISQAMISAHGGTLSAASAGPDQGATFTVELAALPEALPEDANRPATVVPGAKAPAPPAAGARVLLVDDHHDTCLGMSLLLRRRGFSVVMAHCVADALAAAESEGPFDLLISDLGLPDGHGCDLMRALRERPGAPPGIALSGFGMESDLEKTAEAGFSEHLIKPVDFERLDTAIRRLLDGNAPGQAAAQPMAAVRSV